ncbi:MAG: rod shape-determining protein MreC [candidate division WOR-3 bacterium]
MRNEKISFILFFFLSFFFFINPVKKGIHILFIDYLYHPVILLKKNIEKLKNWEKEKEIILKESKRKESKVFSSSYKIYSEESFPPRFIFLYKPENFDSQSKLVFQDENLAGIIKEKGKDKILVETIFSPYFKIDVIDKRSKVLGVLKSKGDFLLELHYVPYWADIREGDTLLTAGIWEIAPQGIKIGVIEKIEREEGEIFMKIKVRPLFDLSKTSIFLLK